MRKKLGIGIGVTAVAALALGGVTVAAAGSTSGRRSVAVSATAKAGGVDVAEARRLAAAAVPDGRVVQVESDDVADRRVWKVIVSVAGGRVSVWVDAATGVVSVGNRPDQPVAPSGVTVLDDAASATGVAADDATRGGDDDGSDDRSSAADDRYDDHGRDRGEHGRGGNGRGGHGHGRDDPSAHR